MKLIIDIPEKLKDYADKCINNEVDYNMVVESINGSLALAAIANGTPLPKGHGRLIDEDTVATFEDEMVQALANAPTIIEADKAERRTRNDFQIYL